MGFLDAASRIMGFVNRVLRRQRVRVYHVCVCCVYAAWDDTVSLTAVMMTKRHRLLRAHMPGTSHSATFCVCPLVQAPAAEGQERPRRGVCVIFEGLCDSRARFPYVYICNVYL